ncbi:transposase [Fodinicola feengrottensis]|uniref:transposase n=1 Tax=Fodinicola feengrottensis TaxID=435914 RepID=UPI003CD07513
MGMISAITAGGSLKFSTFTGSLNPEVSIEFLTNLVRGSRRLVFLILDQHSAHISKMTIEYVNSTNGKLRLFFLPSYSPELNPSPHRQGILPRPVSAIHLRCLLAHCRLG